MPNCKKCQNSFPNKVTIDGKIKNLHTRSYCLKCSPWGDKKGYLLRKNETVKNKIGQTKSCPICKRDFNWTKNDVCSSCRFLYTRFSQREKAIKILGGKCIKCNETNHCFLTFHHINPETKTLEISGAFGHTKWPIIEEELQQCVLLCVKCHIVEHLDTQRTNKVIAYYENSPDGEIGRHV